MRCVLQKEVAINLAQQKKRDLRPKSDKEYKVQQRKKERKGLVVVVALKLLLFPGSCAAPS